MGKKERNFNVVLTRLNQKDHVLIIKAEGTFTSVFSDGEEMCEGSGNGLSLPADRTHVPASAMV